MLRFPIVAVNDAAPSTCSTIVTAPGNPRLTASFAPLTFLLAGSKFVVAGYGWCGRGLASRCARRRRGSDHHRSRSHQGPGSGDGRVPCHVDERSSKIGDVFCTVTGNKSVLTKEHYDVMKNGAIIANSGHFNVEIDIPRCEKMSSSKRTTRNFVEEYSLRTDAKSTCWAKAASSTWRRPKDIRRQ